MKKSKVLHTMTQKQKYGKPLKRNRQVAVLQIPVLISLYKDGDVKASLPIVQESRIS